MPQGLLQNPVAGRMGGEIIAGLETRAESFRHGDVRLELLLPASSEALIDEVEFEADERLPYWAELWPSARALARWTLDAPLPGGRAIELGCGVGLPSLAARLRGADILATDYYSDALLFARTNSLRNGLGVLPTLELDWRDPPPALGRFETVLAADVVYERRMAEALAVALPRLVATGGRVWLADPGRVYLPALLDPLTAAGWSVSEREPGSERSGAADGRMAPIRLLELSPPHSPPK